MDSVVAVVSPYPLDLGEIFDAVSGLRGKSMLSVDQSFGKLHYRLLDTTHAFATDLLKQRERLPNGPLPGGTKLLARRANR